MSDTSSPAPQRLPPRSARAVAAAAVGAAVLCAGASWRVVEERWLGAELQDLGADLVLAEFADDPARPARQGSGVWADRHEAAVAEAGLRRLVAEVSRSRLALPARGLDVRVADPDLDDVLPTRMLAGRRLDPVSAHLPTAVLGRSAADSLGIRSLEGGPIIRVGDAPHAVLGILRFNRALPSLDRAVLIGAGSPAAGSAQADWEPSLVVALTSQPGAGTELARDVSSSQGVQAVWRPAGPTEERLARPGAGELAVALGLLILGFAALQMRRTSMARGDGASATPVGNAGLAIVAGTVVGSIGCNLLAWAVGARPAWSLTALTALALAGVGLMWAGANHSSDPGGRMRHRFNRLARSVTALAGLLWLSAVLSSLGGDPDDPPPPDWSDHPVVTVEDAGDSPSVSGDDNSLRVPANALLETEAGWWVQRIIDDEGQVTERVRVVPVGSGGQGPTATVVVDPAPADEPGEVSGPTPRDLTPGDRLVVPGES